MDKKENINSVLIEDIKLLSIDKKENIKTVLDYTIEKELKNNKFINLEILDDNEFIESWIPYDEKIIFNNDYALKFQETEIYVLKGHKNKNNLIEPKSINKTILWEAEVKNKNIPIYIECLIPYNDFSNYLINGYQLQLIIGKHPNIINIFHSFVGSSILVYPFVTEKIRPYTTYYVTKKYNKLSEYQILTEKQICEFAIQIFEALNHLNFYNISHCCINDDNIFINNGKLMISNFSNSVPCLCIKTNAILLQICERLKNNDIGLYSPEVSNFLKINLNNISLEYDINIWEIFRKNDTYIVGKMLCRFLKSETVYTKKFLNLLDCMICENVNERMEIKNIIDELEKLMI